ncbi:MAG: hypothetical protein AMJ66_01040 [Betaproteobacteria bacterium SG8_40]|jgi:CRISPR-associated DxTHG motif protein|nr:MAG: hypothetical protein AMJ66_01040 [Betaproteobacteria bacterium SG8_40]
MNAFRVLLVVMFVTISAYTMVVISTHGINLLPVFFGAMANMDWPGQFNLDFTCFLVLSALWVSWRHRFSAGGLVLGLVALFGGALFLSAYLLVESIKVDGDVKSLLLGSARAG